MQDGLPPPVPSPLPLPRGTVRPASAPHRRRQAAARARAITAWASVATFGGLAVGLAGASVSRNASTSPPPVNVPTSVAANFAVDPNPYSASPPPSDSGSNPPPASATRGS